MYQSNLFRFTIVIILSISLWLACSKNRNDVTGNIDGEDSVDTTPPAVVTDLRVSRLGTNDVEICWTAPGDDGDSGAAAAYDARLSQDTITAASFDSEPVLSGIGFPFSAGGTQCYSIFDLVGEETYYVAMKTRDEDSNWSAISNCLRFTCLTDSIVVFPDTALDRAIRAAIERPTDPIRRSYLTNLTQLLAPGKGIVVLTGLEYCVALRTLTLADNQIISLAPLSSLQSLQIVNLVNNRVTDLSPLSSLTNLVVLHLNNNPVVNISPLAGLTKLTSLSINTIPATDFSPLSDMTSLQHLAAGGNSFADLGALSQLHSLKSLLLYACNISEITPLAGLDSLEELWLPINQIVDIPALGSLTSLKTLDLSSNRIVDIQLLVDNIGLQTGDVVNLTSNPLSSESISQHIPVLQARGVTVSW